MILSPFLIARCQPSKLLQSIDRPLHHVSQPIHLTVERSSSPFIALRPVGTRNRVSYASPSQKRSNSSAVIALVSPQPSRLQPRSPSSCPLDHSLRHHRLNHCALVDFAWCEHKSHRYPISVYTQMDFGAEPATTPPECLRFWVPFFAPAACSSARMTVASPW